MKTCLIAALLIAAALTSAVAQTKTFKAPVTQTKQTHRPPPPPLTKRAVDGVIPRAVRGGNPLQMLNPKAPPQYGTSQDAVSFDVTDIYRPEKWRGIKFFEFRF